MNAFEVYIDYLALKQHFNSDDYDYFRYNGKTRGSVKSFEKRKDRYSFEKLAKHKDPHNYLLANLIDKDRWVKDMTEDRYQDWQRRQQSLAYLFRADLKTMREDFDSNFKKNGWEPPPIVEQYMQGTLMHETITILLDIQSLWPYYKGYPLWSVDRLRKYAPFLKYERPVYRKYIIDQWQK